MNDILKPCPFCGGEAWVIQILEDLYAVECRKCWTRTGTYQPTKAKAIEVWNRRVNMQESSVPEQEIIHCKDCKFYTPMNRKLKIGICDMTMHHLGDDGFCSTGEKRGK